MQAEEGNSTTLTLSLKSPEHVEPLNLALEQFVSLNEWADLQGPAFASIENVTVAVHGFHPDKRYNKDSRELQNLESLSAVWLQWERLIFEPEDVEFWVRMAVVRGHEGWATMGPDDFRHTALCVTAHLALYEGDAIREALKAKPLDFAAVWRRLYWFTRFYRAWQRIGSEFTPSAYRFRMKRARLASTWKKDAWDYYLRKRAEKPNASVRTIATNFTKLHEAKVSTHEVQVYIGKRKRLTPWQDPSGKTVG